jgi:RNA polymerase sigma factor for flagellar operon FliA
MATAYLQTEAGGMDALIVRHAPLVKRIGHHLAGRLPPGIQVDDLIQAGMIGLMEAAQNYNEALGASFTTYAGIRIRGAMLDEVRRNDWVPRSVHRRARQITEAIASVEQRNGREAKDHEVAAELGLSLAEYHTLLQESRGHRLLGFETLMEGGERANAERIDGASDPGGTLEAEQLRDNLAAVIAHLPERERLVLALYYDEELNLREIGEVLGVTESRVCQIHSQAMLRVKARFEKGVGPDAACRGR